ncbi:MAG: hypothetical protein L6Q54_05575 [Leptospiraceae bacterium]|nr:hypothetical protein [Leptospiraceae bacterium]MCK6380708.1 hypothetical protein [Leptospiraceae bacterium]NUM41248.1 hypothetical protein [Leptospiraceae bacterium]
METDTKFSFCREVRTPSSEIYSIFSNDNDEIQARLDIHIESRNIVSGLLSIFSERNDEEVTALIKEIDDSIVNMADIDKGNFYIEVYTVIDRRGFGKDRKMEN